MKINLIIFTISTKISVLQKIIKNIDNRYPIYCLSPHIAYNNEQTVIKKDFSKEINFISFYEFISQNEMEYCDSEADILVVKKYNSRLGKLSEYYNKIKELKNKIILKNIKSKFDVFDKYILANDLGVDQEVWKEHDYIMDIESIDMHITNNLFSKIKNLLLKKIECNILITESESYYLLGKPNRTIQYLKLDTTRVVKLSSYNNMLFTFLYKLILLKSKGIPIGYLLKQIVNLMKNDNINKILCPIHEHDDSFTNLAHSIKCQYIILQDGYLPNYYTSRYLRYWEKVDRYYIWDKLSAGIFQRHSLECEKWNAFKENLLPNITLSQDFKIKKIVFLSSGSGDWTALKNRSDEDLIFLALIEIAKEFSSIEILFRPHPLWLHPSHQGVNSIQRLIDFVDTLGLPNFKISGGALQEGLAFTKHKNLSTASSSINDDINSSDIILGDHSQSMITAAKQGKLMASISLGHRKDFFSNYSDLGFPVLKSKFQISEFISKVNNIQTRNDLLERYNKSIDKYNREFS